MKGTKKHPADRLAAVMHLLKCRTEQEFADLIGVNRPALNKWLTGHVNYPPVRYMVQLQRHVPGLSLDWIYKGDANTLEPELAIHLLAILQGIEPPSVEVEEALSCPPLRGMRRPRRRPASRERMKRAVANEAA